MIAGKGGVTAAARSLCMLPSVNIVNRQHAVNPQKINFSAERSIYPQTVESRCGWNVQTVHPMESVDIRLAYTPDIHHAFHRKKRTDRDKTRVVHAVPPPTASAAVILYRLTRYLHVDK